MTANPLAIIELDACDEGLLDRFIAEGVMPNMAALQRDGMRRRIGGKHMLSELGSWSTIWSGKPMVEHGYYFHRSLQPGTYDLHRRNPTHARTDPFWARCADGRKSLVMDLSEAFTDTRVKGSQVAYWRCLTSQLYPVETSSQPEELKRQLIREYAPSTCTYPFLMAGKESQAKRLLDDSLRLLARKTDAVLALMKEQQYHFVALGFGEMHIAAHCFWDYGSDYIRQSYAAVDLQLGRILQALPEATTVVALSAYGMKAEYPTTDLPEAVMRRLGYQQSPPSGRKSTLTTMKDLIPLPWRMKLGKHLSIQQQERLITARFRENTDWKRTRAFVIPSLYSSYIQVNLEGREPEGIVQPGAEYSELLDAIERDFLALEVVESGERAVQEVRRTADLTGGEPPRAVPDLIVIWRPRSHMMTHLRHPKGEIKVERHGYTRSTYHTYAGLLIARGTTSGSGDTVDVRSVAPWLQGLYTGEMTPLIAAS